MLQLIYLTAESVEEYEVGKSHRGIAAPAYCPNCRAPGRLHIHGCYFRYTTCDGSGTPPISIRRFLCTACGRTVSMLPSFAQPYRLVLNVTIEAFVAGNHRRPDVQRWAARINQYWRQYILWLPVLRLKLRAMLGGIRRPTAERVWAHIMKSCGSLSMATRQLTRDHAVTMFAEYKCHLPNPP